MLTDAPELPAHLPSPRRRATEAHDISGTTPDGDAVVVSMAVGSNTVLAFLSTGCLTCRTFWDGLQPQVEAIDGGGVAETLDQTGHLDSGGRHDDTA